MTRDARPGGPGSTRLAVLPGGPAAGEGDGSPSGDEDVTHSDIRALALAFGVSAAKLDIVGRLARGPATVSELGEACGFTRHGVEPHLDTLARLGVVRSEIVRVTGAYRPARLYTLETRGLESVRWALHDVLDLVPPAD